MKSNKYSGLAQSHAPLSTTTTRALIPTVRTRKLHGQKLKKVNYSSSSTEQRLHLVASCWAKVKKEEHIRLEEEENKRWHHRLPKYVQLRQRNQRVEDAGRQLCQVVQLEISESNTEQNQTNIQSWLNLLPNCSPPLELWLQPPPC